MDFVNLGSALSLRSFGRLGSSTSVLDFVHLGSTMSVRSFAQAGSAYSVWSWTRFGSSLSVLDFVTEDIYASFYSKCNCIHAAFVGRVSVFVHHLQQV